MTDEILAVLGGEVSGVRERVQEELEVRVEALDFERAATLRDTLIGLDSIERRQRALDVRGGDQDVVGVARDGDHATAVLLRIRGASCWVGRWTTSPTWSRRTRRRCSRRRPRASTSAGASRAGATSRGQVLLPGDFEDRETLEELLNEVADRKIALHVPQRGEKLRLVELAAQNARHLLEERTVLDESGPQPGRRRPVRSPGGAGAQGGAAPHRLLRHLPHPGHGGGGKRRGVRERGAEEERVPPVPDPGRWGRRSPAGRRGRWAARRAGQIVSMTTTGPWPRSWSAISVAGSRRTSRCRSWR
jgi:hypothetical protein